MYEDCWVAGVMKVVRVRRDLKSKDSLDWKPGQHVSASSFQTMGTALLTNEANDTSQKVYPLTVSCLELSCLRLHLVEPPHLPLPLYR
jgi:hypothetical protein